MCSIENFVRACMRMYVCTVHILHILQLGPFAIVFVNFGITFTVVLV